MPLSGTLASITSDGDRHQGTTTFPLVCTPSAKCPPVADTMRMIAVTHTAPTGAGNIGGIIVFGDRLAC